MANPRNRRPGGAPARPAAQSGHTAAARGGHGHDDEKVPPVTTAQGYQTYGVGNKHEERDTNVGAVLGWFGRLAVVTVVVMVVVWGGLTVWENHAAEEAKQVPAMFRDTQTPPEPRVLPQPASDIAGRADLFYPADLAAQEHEKQSALMQKYGLEDADGHNQLPSAALDVVTGSRGGAVAAPVSSKPEPPHFVPQPSEQELSEPMPSLSSGGTALENRLR